MLLICVECCVIRNMNSWSCTQLSERLVHTIPWHMNPANILDIMLGIGSKTCKTHKYVRRFLRSRQLSIRHISFIISIEVLSDWFCMKDSTCCGVYSTLSILSNNLCSSFCLCYAFMYLSPFNRLKFFVFMGLWKDFFIYEIINFIIPPFFVSPKPRRRQGTWRLFLKS